jgi:magnesium chelatase family protein
LSPVKECRCTPIEIKRYRSRLSQPIIERIELHIQLTEEGVGEEFPVTSRELQARVLEAFEFSGGVLPARLPEGHKFNYTEEVHNLLQLATNRFGLSYRAQFNLLKLAQTHAYLQKRRRIEKEDFLAVLRFRYKPPL